MNDHRADQFLEEVRVFFTFFWETRRKKIRSLSINEFKPNPFLFKHLAKSIYGDLEPDSLIKTLIYPYIQGTSPSTSFGQRFQKFISESLPEYQVQGSIVEGMDIQMMGDDSRMKYCQLKSGPYTINAKDVNPIIDEYNKALRLARTNNRDLTNTDLFVGVIYGDRENLSGSYKAIEENFDVKIGNEFWTYLTRRDDIYSRMIDTINNTIERYDFTQDVEELKERLRSDIDRFI